MTLRIRYSLKFSKAEERVVTLRVAQHRGLIALPELHQDEPTERKDVDSMRVDGGSMDEE